MAEVTWTDDQKLEYSELGNLCRHDDAMIYQGASILLPLSYAALPLAIEKPNLGPPLAIASCALYLYWWLMLVRLSWYTARRLERAKELERLVGASAHLCTTHGGSGFGSRVSIRFVRLFFMLVLALSWAWIL